MRETPMLLYFIMAIASALAIAGGGHSHASEWDCLSFSPDGKWLVAGGGKWLESGKVKVWECQKWKLHAEWKGEFSSNVQRVKFISKEEFVTFSNKRDERDKRKNDGNEMGFWNINKKTQLKKVYLENSRSWAANIDYSPEKKMVVFNQWEPFGTAGLYVMPSLENKLNYGKDLNYNTWCRFSPDFKKVVLLSDLELQLFDIETGKCLNRRELESCTYKTLTRALTFSPDGALVAVGLSYPHSISVFSSDLKSVLFTVERKQHPFFAAFSPDSKEIAFAGADGVIDFFSIETKKVSRELKVGKGGVGCCCFSTNGTLVAVGVGPTVQVVEIKTGKVIADLK
jgi:WD40 repeat protein